MFKKILKFLGLANNPIPALNSNDYTHHILNCDLSDEKYRKKFGQWLPNYLEQSESLTEKKYKLLFIYALLHDKESYIYSIIPESSTLIKNIETELIENNETKLKITELFPENQIKILMAYHHSRIDKYYKNSKNDDSLFFSDFIDEDKINPEKSVIARKVYKDFSNLGLLGNAIINDSIHYIELLLEMQNFKLNNLDVEKIKQRLSIIENTKKPLVEPPFCTDEVLLEKLILNEDYIVGLKELQKFYSYKSKIHLYMNEDEFSFYNVDKLIETRINYLTLAKEMIQLDNNNEPGVKKIKKNKI